MQNRRRRWFLRAALGGAALLLGGAAGSRFGARAQSAPGRVRETALRGRLVQLSGGGGNVVLLGSAEGLLMVDSGAPEDTSPLMSRLAERFGDSPIEVLFNTHWHLEHTGGNEAAGRAGARIIAHENTRLWMSTEFHVDWQQRTYSPRPLEARPTETFYSSRPQPIELRYSDERIEYGQLREAHTDGDIYVRFPEHDVIVAGGAVSVGEYPVPDYMTGGLIDGLIGATRKLIEMSSSETLIVPAAGPPQTRRHLEAQHEMLSTVLERIRTKARMGKSVEEMLADGITSDFDEYWGRNGARFVSNVYKGLWGLGR